METNTQKQTIIQKTNANGTFSYYLNDVCIVKSGKKDYSFFVTGCNAFSNSVKNAQSQINFWLKYGSDEMKARTYIILNIEK